MALWLMTSNISENINHILTIYISIYIYIHIPIEWLMTISIFHSSRRRWAWEMPITSWSIAGRSRIRARCRWLGTSGGGEWLGFTKNAVDINPGKFDHDRTLISRALESWFLYGKSSPNGRTIQWIILIYPDQWQHGHMLYKDAYNMNI